MKAKNVSDFQVENGRGEGVNVRNGRLLFLTLLLWSIFISEGMVQAAEEGFPVVENSLSIGGPTTYADMLTAEELEEIGLAVIDSPPTPPSDIMRAKAAVFPTSAVLLNEVPTSRWTYGCAATAAGMLFGYYDRNGYSDIYTGPTNDGNVPLTNLGQGQNPAEPIEGSCSIIATQNGFDGRDVNGHVDDYWIGYSYRGPDPWQGNWEEHLWGECVADFMGTSQWKWDMGVDGNTDSFSDGATLLWLPGGGVKLYDFVQSSTLFGSPSTALCHGMRLFSESRGYAVLENYTQRTTVSGDGFSFADYMAEIDSGYPVMLHVTGHSMAGVGYDEQTETVYLHDTWDNDVHSMTWGGSYAGRKSMAVTVIHILNISYIEIDGLASVRENSSAQYTCTAYGTGGNSVAVTSSVVWTVNPSYASIDSSGHLISDSVFSDEVVQVTASYGEWSDTFDVTIYNRAVDYIEITGPGEVGENGGAQYSCTVYYEDASTGDMTDEVSWAEDSAYASIDSSGYITTVSVDMDQPFEITVIFGDKSDAYEVTIKDGVPEYIRISGAATVLENSGAQYTCTAYFEDGSTADVTGGTSWSDNSVYAQIDSRGYLRTYGVDSDKGCQITASYRGRYFTYYVSIVNSTATVVNTIEISGPERVRDNFRVQYKCTVCYDDGSTADVTHSVNWSEDSNCAEIDGSGYLTTYDVNFDRPCRIQATYNSDSVFYDVAITEGIVYVDDDAPGDPGPGDPMVSDPCENGKREHPFDSIQEAIDLSLSVYGGTVILENGTYTGEGNHDIDFWGKVFIVRGTDPNDANTVAATVIDCQGTAADYRRGFYFHSDEDANFMLAGVTIKNGYSERGSGIYCINDSGPTLMNCIIRKCRSSSGGVVEGSRGPITTCTVKDNWVGGNGSGLYNCDGPISNSYIGDNEGEGENNGLEGCDGSISDCEISNNFGSGLRNCSGAISDCNISYNSGYGLSGCTAAITNCTIMGNMGGVDGGSGIITTSTISYNLSHGICDCNSAISGCEITNNEGRGFTGCTGPLSGCVVSGNLGGFYNCSGQISGCIIRDNISSTDGGGLWGCDGAIIGCDIITNSASNNGGGLCDCNGPVIGCVITGNQAGNYGGGLKNCNNVITDCVIADNSAREGGGLLCCAGAITGCTISRNVADYHGGGLFDCGGPITRCLISWNTAMFNDGGGLFWCNGKISNCTIADNQSGGAGGGVNSRNAELVNCIIWNNTASSGYGQLYNEDLLPSYCCIEDWSLGGDGNIGSDPLFADPCSGDYHLKSEFGRWDPNSESWVYDGQTSPCIDGGNVGFDWTGELWPHGQRVNMGVYGGTSEASMSPAAMGIVCDFNFDYVVDGLDLGVFSENWLVDEDLLAADSDRNGLVNMKDFAFLAGCWFESEEACFLVETGEDFESGDFGWYDWQHDGDANWVLESGGFCFDGNSVRSGDVGHNEQSILEFTLEFESNRIGFYRRVSCENGYDWLCFYIDGIKQEQWCGDEAWGYVSYAVSPGEHTFRWSYEKDYSGDEGLDCCWVDDIRFYFDPRE